MQKVNLSDQLGRLQEFWSPKVVGAVNDFHLKLVKLKGEFVWHSHEREDELFLVLQGSLRMQFRDHEVAVEPGEFIIVPQQTEHRPVADDEVHVLLLEPKSTVNTGKAGGERTREVEWIGAGGPPWGRQALSPDRGKLKRPSGPSSGVGTGALESLPGRTGMAKSQHAPGGRHRTLRGEPAASGQAGSMAAKRRGRQRWK